MTEGRRALRLAFYLVWSVLMTGLTYVLGAAPLKVLRAKGGRALFWLAGTGLSCGFFAADARLMAVAFFSLVLLTGVFSEFEEMGLGFMLSGFFTLLINGLLGAGAFAFWISLTGPKWSQQILTFLETMLKPLADLNPHLQVNPYDLMLQLPSVVMLLWMGALYLAVLLENRLAGGLEPKHAAMRAQLGEFRLPDPVVWIFIASLLGAFGGFGGHALEAVAVNIMNVCLMLFFFQGVAVVGRLFTALRMGALWQFVFMMLIVLHLFLFVSLLGLMDYWLDFRSRLSKRAETFNREV
jgi:hypothetical protein